MFAAVLAAYATTRLNIPILIGFLGLGMLLGSDGPGGIAFSDAHLARVVGVLCLAARWPCRRSRWARSACW